MPGGRPAVDLTGRTFGDWTVLAFSHSDGKARWWRARCVCGNERVQRGWVLTKGKSLRCGTCSSRKEGELFVQRRAEEWAGTEANGWIVLAHAGTVSYGAQQITMWTCRCITCGAVVDVPRTSIHKPTMPVCRHGIIPNTEE